MDLRYQLEKLDSNNYNIWCIQAKSVLIQNDLWPYVDGTSVKPEVAAELATWKVKDEKALALIILSVKSDQLNYIKNCTSSKAAWEKLKEVHQPHGPIRKVTLFKQLLQTKMSENETASVHIQKFFDVVEKLSDIGITLENELLGILLLSSLPKSYDNLVIAIESRDSLPSLDVIKIKILDESNRREQGNSENNDNEQVYFSEAKVKTKSAKKEVKGRCFNCNGIGHYAANCKKRKNKQKDSKVKNTMFSMLNANNITADIDSWIVDSGSTCHMSCRKEWFIQLKEKKEKIYLATNKIIESSGIGDVKLNADQGTITLKNVLFVPELEVNIISVSKAVISGLIVTFKAGFAEIKRGSKEILLRAENKNNLFVYQQGKQDEHKKNSLLLNLKDNTNDIMKWHKRFGHLNFKYLMNLMNRNMVRGLDLTKITGRINCEICAKGKICRKPFTRFTETQSKSILELVHVDVCGPMRNKSLGGSRYFAVLVDDFSRKLFVYTIKHKHEVFSVFRAFKNLVEKQTGKQIKILRSDNGGEFIGNEFKKYLENNGIKHQLTADYTPQQNGIAERANRTLVEMSRCMLMENSLPEYFWGEAVHTAAYIKNRSPTKMLGNKTPEEAWTGIKPTVSYLKTFGCKAIMLNKHKRSSKFAPKGIDCIFVGYCENSKAYRLYDMKARRLYKSRDVKFMEPLGNSDKISFNNHDYVLLDNNVKEEDPNAYGIIINENKCESDSDSDEYEEAQTTLDETYQDNTGNQEINNREYKEDDQDLEEEASDYTSGQGRNYDNEYSQDTEETECNDKDNEDSNETRDKSTTPKPRGRPRILRTGRPGRPRKGSAALNIVQTKVENSNPKTVREALKGEESQQWIQAMEEEYKTLIKNTTWKLVDLPNGKKAIKSKWVFNTKRDKDGNITKYKARLVAKGCSQTYGVDYSETFSPVARHSTIKIVLALAVEYNLLVHQIDVTSAYLNSELKDEIYMEQPENFVDENNKDKVCRLEKSLYGLKQSGREWNQKINEVLERIGFTKCKTDTCIYTRNTENIYNIVVLYVDDIIIACSEKQELDAIKYELANNFEIVDKGAINYYLGMEFEREDERGALEISQKQLIENLLESQNMSCCRRSSIPLDPGTRFKKCNDCTKCDTVDRTEYQSVIGSLLYIGLLTRPDILHSVIKLSQFNQNPHREHLAAVKQLLRYLNGTKHFKLTYKKNEKGLEGYADADWAGSLIDRKSYTGYVFMLAGGPVSWHSSKQKSVALSTMEAEYMAIGEATKELLYLRRLIKDLGFHNVVNRPTTLNSDNVSAQQLLKNPVFHNRSKHIDIRAHFVREVYQNKEMDVNYVPTEEMVADILTKNLKKNKHDKVIELLNLENHKAVI